MNQKFDYSEADFVFCKDFKKFKSIIDDIKTNRELLFSIFFETAYGMEHSNGKNQIKVQSYDYLADILLPSLSKEEIMLCILNEHPSFQIKKICEAKNIPFWSSKSLKNIYRTANPELFGAYEESIIAYSELDYTTRTKKLTKDFELISQWIQMIKLLENDLEKDLENVLQKVENLKKQEINSLNLKVENWANVLDNLYSQIKEINKSFIESDLSTKLYHLEKKTLDLKNEVDIIKTANNN